MILSIWLLFSFLAILKVAQTQIAIITITNTRRPSTCSNPSRPPFTTTVTVNPSSWSSLASSTAMSGTADLSSIGPGGSVTGLPGTASSTGANTVLPAIPSSYPVSSVQPSQSPSQSPSQTVSESPSVIIVTTSIIVSPTPVDDLVNAGEPFNLAIDIIQNLGRKHKRQTNTTRVIRVYVQPNGNTTSDPSRAVKFRLLNQTLLADNVTMSTGPEIDWQIFAAKIAVGPWTTSFFVSQGKVMWNRTEFEGGSATFYRNPPDQVENAQILVQFRGSNHTEWAPLTFQAAPGTLSHYSID